MSEPTPHFEPPDYRQYINSTKWRARRARFFKTRPKRCAGCGVLDESIHLHHHTYERLGRELDSDLVPVCEPCHAIIHKWHNLRGGSLTAVTNEFLRASAASRRQVKPKPKRPEPEPPVPYATYRGPIGVDRRDAPALLEPEPTEFVPRHLRNAEIDKHGRVVRPGSSPRPPRFRKGPKLGVPLTGTGKRKKQIP